MITKQEIADANEVLGLEQDHYFQSPIDLKRQKITLHLKKGPYCLGARLKMIGHKGMNPYEFIKKHNDEVMLLIKPDSRFPGLKGNFKTHINQIFYVYEKYNIGISYDIKNKTLCSALYLDGRDGYTGETPAEWRLKELTNKYK